MYSDDRVLFISLHQVRAKERTRVGGGLQETLSCARRTSSTRCTRVASRPLARAAAWATTSTCRCRRGVAGARTTPRCRCAGATLTTTRSLMGESRSCFRMQRIVSPALRAFKPDLILVSSGERWQGSWER